MEIKRCTRCIMDNSSDETIVFDSNGVCNYCSEAEMRMAKVYFPNKEGEIRLDNILKQIKLDGEGKDYDCVMGISGGLDSSYLAYLGYKWGLRILAVHIDDGFDTEISKKNIKNLIEASNIKMITICPDKEEYCDLTKAYMKAGVPNIAIPQDNILFAFVYDVVRKYNIKYFLTGGNFALECILQHGNTYDAMDVVNIKDIHKKFGTKPINKLKFISSAQKIMDARIFGLKTIRLLDLIDYNRERAFNELKEFCNFEYYGRKHLENELTKFIQLYWFYKKFGVDKRTSHLSSMIVSGQMTREQAMEEYKKPIYDEDDMKICINLIKKELSISDAEFDQIMVAPTHQHDYYKTQKLVPLIRKIFKR